MRDLRGNRIRRARVVVSSVVSSVIPSYGRLAAIGFGVLGLATTAYGDEVPKAESTQVGWISVVVALLLIVSVGVGCFMNPKRTHQD